MTKNDSSVKGSRPIWAWLIPLVIVCGGAFLFFKTRKQTPPGEAVVAQQTNAVKAEPIVAAAPDGSETNAAPEQKFEEMQDHEKAAFLSDRGDDLLARGNFLGAIDSLQESLKYDPAVETVHYNLGIAYARAGKNKESIAAYEKAIELAPDYAEAHNNLGNLLVKLGRLDEGVEHFKESIRINPEDAMGYNNLGTALGRQRLFSAAGEQFAKAAALSPKYVEARFNLANAYIEQGMLTDAVRELRGVLEINPQFTPARQSLARISERARSSATPPEK